MKMRAGWMSLCVVLLVFGLLSAGCQRSPEDLEKWRNAKGGMEKMEGWALSKEETPEVRKRAVVILIEQGHIDRLPELFKKLGADPIAPELMKVAVAEIDKMWATQDFPKLDDKLKEKGGQIAVGDSKAIKAKDAAYYLQPYATGEDKAKLEKILTDWVSADHELRNQLGKTTLVQVLPRADKGAVPGFLKWLETALKPASIARQIRESKDNEPAAQAELVKQLDLKILEVANAKKADLLSGGEVVASVAELRIAVTEVAPDTQGLVPLLEEIILSETAPGDYIDLAMDVLVKAQKEKSTAFFNKLVSSSKGLKRWVAVTRLIEVRGRPGVLQAVNALPLEPAAYEAGELEENTSYFCNFLKSEFEAQQIKDQVEPTVKQLLSAPRWPAQLLGIECAKMHKLSGLKADVEALAKSKQAVPGWGDGNVTIGARAKEVAAAL
jgi:hypothetical protein